MAAVLTTEIPPREAITGVERTTPAGLDAYESVCERSTALMQNAPR